MKNNKLSGSLILMLCALIWGTTFVAQSEGAEHISPMWFICIRNAMGSLVLLPYIFVSDSLKRRKGRNVLTLSPGDKKAFVSGGAICGLCLCVAAYLQQLGITLGTPSGKSAFITSLYIILVPVFSIFLKKRVKLIVWISAFLSIVGLYFLCMDSSYGVQVSDLIVFSCSFIFAIQIIVVDLVSPRFDPVKLSSIQFAFCSLFAFVYALFFEEISVADLRSGWFSLVFSGVVSSGIAYTLQIVGQKRLSNPTIASMIMSLESVFGAASSAIILKQRLSFREIIGAGIMFFALILAQLPIETRRRSTY